MNVEWRARKIILLSSVQAEKKKTAGAGQRQEIFFKKDKFSRFFLIRRLLLLLLLFWLLRSRKSRTAQQRDENGKKLLDGECGVWACGGGPIGVAPCTYLYLCLVCVSVLVYSISSILVFFANSKLLYRTSEPRRRKEKQLVRPWCHFLATSHSILLFFSHFSFLFEM